MLLRLLSNVVRPWGVSATTRRLRSIDQNARAFGYEIAKGASIDEPFVSLSPENPFRNSNWRSKKGK